MGLLRTGLRGMRNILVVGHFRRSQIKEQHCVFYNSIAQYIIYYQILQWFQGKISDSSFQHRVDFLEERKPRDICTLTADRM